MEYKDHSKPYSDTYFIPGTHEPRSVGSHGYMYSDECGKVNLHLSKTWRKHPRSHVVNCLPVSLLHIIP